MGKKKKKGAPAVAKLSPKTTETTTTVDCLAVRGLGPPKASSHRISQSCVALTQSDAQKLDVISNEQVFVISIHQETIRAVVANARIMISPSPSSSATLPSPSKGQRQSSSLPEGHIQIDSLDLWKILVPEQSTQLTSPNPTSLSSPLTQTPPRTPSTPETPFSFRNDPKLYTPSPSSSSKRPPYSPQSSSKRTTVDLYVVPYDSDLGLCLVQKLCRTATTIRVRPLDTSATATATSSIPNAQTLTQLFQAFFLHQYCQLDQYMTITVVGKYTTFQIVKILEDEKVDYRTPSIHQDAPDTLIQQLEKLSLRNDDIDDTQTGITNNDISFWKKVCESNVQLYQITTTTKLVLSIDDKVDKNQENVHPKQFVVGLDREIEAVVDILQAPIVQAHVFASRSIRPPRGVLVHGPSGVGKSGLAQHVAHRMTLHCQVDIQFVSCLDLQTKLTIVGEAERALNRYFLQRHPTKATLLIMDDIHLICPRRGSTHNVPGVDQLASTLLSLMDGVDGSDGITSNKKKGPLVILALTTNPSLLDPALRRPGRLDTEIEIPAPDEPLARANILKFHCQRMGSVLSESLGDKEWLGLGKLAKGFTGADCMLAIKEATRNMLLSSKSSEYTTAVTSQSLLTYQHIVHGIQQTKPSSIRAITVEIPKVQWSDIGGMEDVKRELREAIEQPVVQVDLYNQLRLPSPRGILLYGPPGCSKTLTARALATEGQMNFLAVKGPELFSKWLGESERALASLFRRARMASPSIIFFDEMDAIASRRGSGDSTSSSRMLSQLLTELDGVSSGGVTRTGKTPRLVVVGATNRPDLLDPALTRPGRMDRMIYVGPPDLASRERIFDIGLKGRPCEATVDKATLARDSEGFSGAEIIAICRDAALLALEENAEDTASPVISFAHLKRAIRNTNKQISPEMLAFYESFRQSKR
jgi:SpoVK/Ycf46/Vps4 family AAA+-type ATPase